MLTFRLCISNSSVWWIDRSRSLVYQPNGLVLFPSSFSFDCQQWTSLPSFHRQKAWGKTPLAWENAPHLLTLPADPALFCPGLLSRPIPYRFDFWRLHVEDAKLWYFSERPIGCRARV
jgi:hypothetical protein